MTSSQEAVDQGIGRRHRDALDRFSIAVSDFDKPNNSPALAA
jgi:hypothetical protein